MSNVVEIMVRANATQAERSFKTFNQRMMETQRRTGRTSKEMLGLNRSIQGLVRGMGGC